MPNGQELAQILWMAVTLIFCLTRKDLRVGLIKAVRGLLQPYVASALSVVVAWIAGEVWLGSRSGLWSTSAVTDTCFWFATSAFVLFIYANDVAQSPRFFARTVRTLFALSAFAALLVNLTNFPIPLEVFLVPVEVAFVGVSVVAVDAEQRPARVFSNALLMIIGVALVVWGLVHVANGWPDDRSSALRSAALPFWLTIGFLPMIYLLGVAMEYQTQIRMNTFGFASRWSRIQWSVALISVFNVRVRALATSNLEIVQACDENLSYAEMRRSLKLVRERSAVEAGETDGVVEGEPESPVDLLAIGIAGPLAGLVRSALLLALRQPDQGTLE